MEIRRLIASLSSCLACVCSAPVNAGDPSGLDPDMEKALRMPPRYYDWYSDTWRGPVARAQAARDAALPASAYLWLGAQIGSAAISPGVYSGYQNLHYVAGKLLGEPAADSVMHFAAAGGPTGPGPEFAARFNYALYPTYESLEMIERRGGIFPPRGEEQIGVTLLPPNDARTARVLALLPGAVEGAGNVLVVRLPGPRAVNEDGVIYEPQVRLTQIYGCRACLVRFYRLVNDAALRQMYELPGPGRSDIVSRGVWAGPFVKYSGYVEGLVDILRRLR